MNCRVRRWIAEGLHLALACAALVTAFLLRFDFPLDAIERRLLGAVLVIVLAVKLPAFRLFGLRDLAWRYTGLDDLLRIAAANLAASAAAGVVSRSCWGRRLQGLSRFSIL